MEQQVLKVLLGQLVLLAALDSQDHLGQQELLDQLGPQVLQDPLVQLGQQVPLVVLEQLDLLEELVQLVPEVHKGSQEAVVLEGSLVQLEGLVVKEELGLLDPWVSQALLALRDLVV